MAQAIFSQIAEANLEKSNVHYENACIEMLFLTLSFPYLVIQGYHPTDPTKTQTALNTTSTGAAQTVALPSLQMSNTIGNGFVSTLINI